MPTSTSFSKVVMIIIIYTAFILQLIFVIKMKHCIILNIISASQIQIIINKNINSFHTFIHAIYANITLFIFYVPYI